MSAQQTELLALSSWVRDTLSSLSLVAHTLLPDCSVLSILLATTFFAALNIGTQSTAADGALVFSGSLLSDNTRDQILYISRGLAVILLVIYISSRIFLRDSDLLKQERHVTIYEK